MQIKPKIKVIRSSEHHIEGDIERLIDEGYVLQGAVQVVPSHHQCHWTYVATMVLKGEQQ